VSRVDYIVYSIYYVAGIFGLIFVGFYAGHLQEQFKDNPVMGLVSPYDKITTRLDSYVYGINPTDNKRYFVDTRLRILIIETLSFIVALALLEYGYRKAEPHRKDYKKFVRSLFKPSG